VFIGTSYLFTHAHLGVEKGGKTTFRFKSKDYIRKSGTGSIQTAAASPHRT